MTWFSLCLRAREVASAMRPIAKEEGAFEKW